MRLINFQTFELEEFNDNDKPRYAILSHTWEALEITYAQWNRLDRSSRASESPKIDGFQRVAQEVHDLSYGWVDTCCINKDSSAELTEAINSMYRYYAEAVVCIVHLADVYIPEIPGGTTALQMFEASRWFTRGWTLQELIAPPSLVFYTKQWALLGTSSTWLDRIATISGIPSAVLQKTSPLSEWSIATRMSWASKRKTTRIEDEAYSLLGIFEVSLPLIYGEGHRAFMRLQEEIIRRSTDHSIFAWDKPLKQQSLPSFTASAIAIQPLKADGMPEHLELLAASPADFAVHEGAQQIVQCFQDVKGWVESYDMTNLGLELSLPLVSCTSQLGVYHAVLNCRFDNDPKGPIALNLRRSSQTSSRLRHESNYDLLTTTFGVMPMSRLPSATKSRCTCRHMNRLSVVDEENLLDNEKKQATILRTHQPKLGGTVLGHAKSRMGAARLTRKLEESVDPTLQSCRLKLLVHDDYRLFRIRRNAQPASEWDVKSLIWHAKSPAAAIAFASGDHDREFTLMIVRSRERNAPFHVVLSTVPDCQVPETAGEARHLQQTAPALYVGMKINHPLPFAMLQYTLDRHEKMGNTYHIMTLTITDPSDSFGPYSPEPSPPTGPPVDMATVSRQAHTLADEPHQQNGQLALIAEDSLSSLLEMKGDVLEARRLAKKFSFE